jgi:spore photoproduct lyase
MSQSNVYWKSRKSKFINPFWKEGGKPEGVLCFPFYEAKFSNGCLYACEYCYLKGTFRYINWNGWQQTVFTNIHDLLAELEEFMKVDKPSVLHTGEVADSLAVRGSEEIMATLIERFAKQDKHTLLILTKSDNVDELLTLNHNGRTVIGFSINPSSISERYELEAPSTENRFKAAIKCINAGYKVMLRVDPMIPVQNWRYHYTNLFNKLNTMNLYGVVVGTLRAFPNLKSTMSDELKALLTHKDVDGRYHIPYELRWEMYKLAISVLKLKRIGICKESGQVWARIQNEIGHREFICNCHL